MRISDKLDHTIFVKLDAFQFLFDDQNSLFCKYLLKIIRMLKIMQAWM